MTGTTKIHERFEALDALRGVAAIAVLLLHIGEPWVAPHGYLAVDFFFCLSGFVIASAYENKLQRGSLGFFDFIKLRLVRLYPLVIAGALLGAVGYSKVYIGRDLGIVLATGILLIPTPLSPVSEGTMAIPVNPPSWSLLAEILGNIFYGIIAAKLSRSILIAVICISGTILFYSAFKQNTIGLGATWSELYYIAPRFCFSFFSGILLFRIRSVSKVRKFKIPLSILIILLCAIFVIPAESAENWMIDIAVVFFGFPLITLIGASARVSVFPKICRLAGELSYPVYILQGGIAPHIRAVAGHLGLTGVSSLLPQVVMVVPYIAFSYLVLKIYDEPIRRRLLRGWLRPEKAPMPTAV